jgi:signal transduction histidine kinase
MPRVFRLPAGFPRDVFRYSAIAVLTVLLCLCPLPAQQLQKHHVPVLVPDESGVGRSGLLDKAIQAAAFGPDVVFYPEYLDAARFRNPDYEESIAHYLQTKYASQKVDVALAAGYAGLMFAIKHGPAIFGAAPVVFVGVEQSRIAGLRLPPGFTGVTHFDDVRGTLEGALQLQPDTTQVAVVAGTAPDDEYWLQHDRAIFDQMAARVRFRYLTDLPMLALLRELNQLKPHTIVFVHAFSRDGTGQDFSDSEMADLIGRNTNAPLYGSTANPGFAGRYASAEDDRRFPMAVEIVRRILAGEKAAAIPIQQAKAEHAYVFDARQLRRWNIDPQRVPRRSLLVNREPSFWQVYRNLAAGVLLFFVLESGLVAVLLIQRARRRKAEELLADRNARLEESEQSLRELSGKLIDAQEEERKRIARELHDDLNQQVADLGISLSNIKRAMPASMEKVRGELVSVQQRLLTLSDGLRHVSHELHPGMLELFGLAAAMKSHCKEFSAITKVPVEFESDCEGPVADDVALCLYRIGQEALRNAAKHARASQVEVRLAKRGKLLELTVTDDGIGFDVQEAGKRGGLGLRSIAERAWLVHGKIEVESRPGGGSRLTVSIESGAAEEAPAPVRAVAHKAK